MITDEQRKAFEKWVVENTPFTEPRKYNSGLYEQQIHHFLWESWQAAQQVKGLDFQSWGYGYIANTPLCRYYIYADADTQTVGITMNDAPILGDYATFTEAITAANADYQRRVLSCLVWGVV